MPPEYGLEKKEDARGSAGVLESKGEGEVGWEGKVMWRLLGFMLIVDDESFADRRMEEG